ncbi:hypothetical protein PHJA_001398800 [Phtheirospermum japonicum]|uniref:Uncharacterized protein n=1 Tax=Phtheirospermum japonicum TaxID=374723 RepID=A0A830C0A8_9LAMI|nr:hypothetical protein PHJA_001398800 [Phtheirospermum japonicum]
MAPEPTKHHDSTSHDTEKQKSLDREIKELISALTTRLSTIQRPHKPVGSTSNIHNNQDDDEDEQGVRIITLAGNNLGATMRGDTEDKLPVGVGPQDLEQDDFSTYVNSNFQAINNSIMLGGSYKTNDPGVHLDISDYDQQKGGKNKRRDSRSDNRQQRQAEKSGGTSDSENS